MKLRIGLIGIGHAWENRHRPALRALSDRFEVRAVCEPVAHRAAIVARDFGAVAVDGFSALAQREDIDAILILSGQWFRALPILAACDAGKAVYCAAPLDFPPEVALAIQQRLERSGVAFVAELPQRHAAATLRLKELIATRLGSPRLVFCHQRIPAEAPGLGRRTSHRSCRCTKWSSWSTGAAMSSAASRPRFLGCRTWGPMGKISITR